MPHELPGPCHPLHVVTAFPFLLSGLPGFGRKGWGNMQKLSCCRGVVGMHLKGETFCTNGSH